MADAKESSKKSLLEEERVPEEGASSSHAGSTAEGDDDDFDVDEAVDDKYDAEAMAKETEARKHRNRKLHHKQRKMEALQQRLFDLRYSDLSANRTEEDVARDVKNLINELKRAIRDVRKVEEENLLAFEESLNLSDIGIKGHPISSKARRQKKKDEKITITVDSPPEEEEYDLEMDRFIDANLMRTRSTHTLEGQDARQRWQSLFRMFREWKHQTTMADAHLVLEKDETKRLRAEELTKLRAAIAEMERKKNKTPADERLLKQLRFRLRRASQHELGDPRRKSTSTATWAHNNH